MNESFNDQVPTGVTLEVDNESFDIGTAKCEFFLGKYCYTFLEIFFVISKKKTIRSNYILVISRIKNIYCQKDYTDNRYVYSDQSIRQDKYF